MNRFDALLAGRLVVMEVYKTTVDQIETMEAQQIANCTKWFAMAAAQSQRYLSNLAATAPSIAAIALQNKRHTDNILKSQTLCDKQGVFLDSPK